MIRIGKRLSSSQIIILGFAALILIGSLLLMLPISTQDGSGAIFSDALFTATSAVCVTGLIVQDTATYWSAFGQAVIIALIQIGGMGVITVAVALSTLSGQKVSLKQRTTMQESISAHTMGGIVELTGFIIRMTIFIESAVYKSNALMNGNLFALSMALVIFGLFNWIFVGGFFKTAYKFAKPFVTFIIACFFVIFLAEALHHIPGLAWINAFGTDCIGQQFILLAAGILLFLLMTLLSCRKACIDFEGIDL